MKYFTSLNIQYSLNFYIFDYFFCSIIVSGLVWAKVRSMFDHSGNPVAEAKLSEAVQIIGWRDLPSAGDEVLEVENEKRVHMIMRYREAQKATQLAQEHKIAADKKHEEHLKVNFC